MTKLNFRGAFVLTSRVYDNVQSQINKAITAYESNVTRLFNRAGGDTTSDAFVTGEARLHARLDALMGHLEFSLPFGANMAPNDPTGGVGLSDKTAATTLNSASTGESVAQLLSDAAFAATTTQDLRSGIEQVRVETLALGGLLPEYVVDFGPQAGLGVADFGLANSK